MAGPLRGAWTLNGRPGEDRLRLEADPRRVLRRDGRVLAWEGFLFAGKGEPWDLEARFEGNGKPGGGPEGHFTAIWADPARGEFRILRDPTGGERIYFSMENGVLLFSSSLKALLEWRKDQAALDPEIAFERGLAELTLFGDRTLIAGVHEVLPGHRLTVRDGEIRQEWVWGNLLEPLEGDPAGLARGLRAALKDAVERCLPPNGEIAIAVSGGIDSAAVAALAVELAGPDRVRAFTYEYQDPGHPSETALAAATCRHLGIRDHRVIPITLDDFLDCVPGAVWSAEDPGYWKRSYPIALAKASAAAGHDRFLTGFGIGSHMGFLEELGGALEFLPVPELSLRFWRGARETGRTAGWPSRLHPGLEAPMHRLYYPLLALLRARGIVSDLRPFFPESLAPFIESALDSDRVARDLESLSALPLARQAQTAAFLHMNSCADAVRCERVSREFGAVWLGPAHFPSCLPYFYLPPHPLPPLGDPRRRWRPGKLLLREAMRGVLPDEVMHQKKNWSQTIGSRAWRDRALARMDAAAGPSWDALRPLFGAGFDDARRYSPEGMIPLAFWHRLFLERGRTSPPSWAELESRPLGAAP